MHMGLFDFCERDRGAHRNLIPALLFARTPGDVGRGRYGFFTMVTRRDGPRGARLIADDADMASYMHSLPLCSITFCVLVSLT